MTLPPSTRRHIAECCSDPELDLNRRAYREYLAGQRPGPFGGRFVDEARAFHAELDAKPAAGRRQEPQDAPAAAAGAAAPAGGSAPESPLQLFTTTGADPHA